MPPRFQKLLPQLPPDVLTVLKEAIAHLLAQVIANF
jgi:hypothetical protein